MQAHHIQLVPERPRAGNGVDIGAREISSKTRVKCPLDMGWTFSQVFIKSLLKPKNTPRGRGWGGHFGPIYVPIFIPIYMKRTA